MRDNHRTVSQTPDNRLNQTDTRILELLEEGRETTGSIADKLNLHPQTIRDRMRWLREWNYVRYYHQGTGLHELVDEN